MNMNRSILLTVGLFVAGLASACNYTDGACYAPGQGGAPGTGPGTGGVIVPTGVGGLGNGDNPPAPTPQGAGDPADPCNTAQGKVYTCNGDVVCHHPNGSTDGCHYVNQKEGGSSAGEVIERLITECQSGKTAGYSCEQYTLTCNDGPVVAKPVYYSCNGGVSCTDAKGFADGCNYSNEEVYADDESEAIDLLVEQCEIALHDKYGNNCDHGGMCCAPGSLTCHKK